MNVHRGYGSGRAETMVNAERLRLDEPDSGGDRHVVVVNLSGQPAQARISLDWPDLPGRRWQLTEILGQNVFERDGGELASPGLFVDLEPWQFHLLALQ
jgi:hypothetical protein